MPSYTGQLVRIVGLLMEMFGLSSIALASPDGTGHWFGMKPNQVWAIIGVGFVFWLTGTFLNFQEATRRREREDDELGS